MTPAAPAAAPAIDDRGVAAAPAICLLNMPFGSLTRPALALALFKAQLREAGLAARSINLNLDFARMINFGSYEGIAMFKGVETQVSEWLFARAAWGRDFGPSEEEFIQQCGEELRTIPKVTDPRAWLLRVRHELITPFLEHCYQRVCAGGVPAVVVFSCMFFQTVSSLALGRLLKERHPEIKLAYGGACFHGEMGEELMRAAPFIDAVSLGEADDVIVPLLRALQEGALPRGLQGILYRDAADKERRVYGDVPSTPVTAEVLDGLPDPDFDDFFADAARVRLTEAASWRDRVTLNFEASRGCWWGQKKHCTFCGLNGQGMEFRAKDAGRVEAMLRRLAARYPVRFLQATDNILAMSYWRTLVPALEADPLRSSDGQKVELFFEVKANLTRPQVAELARAGITYIQPGIESLSSSILEHMGKGVTALQNVYLLKTATEHAVVVYWNLLIRVPGERVEDYAQMERWLPLLYHLRPPSGGAPKVECHRFSPYYFRKGQWTTEVRAARWYQGLFPQEQVNLDRVAYYFDATWKQTLGDPAYDQLLQQMHQWIHLWRDNQQVPRLTQREVAGGLELCDTRLGEPVLWQLGARDAALYRGITDIASPRRVWEQLPETLQGELSEAAVRGQLLEMVAQGLALTERDRFLGLALPPEVGVAAVDRRRVQVRRIANQQPQQAPPQLRVIG